LKGTPDEILPHLFLGSAQHASQKGTLKTLGITAILNVSTAGKDQLQHGFRCMQIPVEDSGSADLSFWFDDAIFFISKFNRV